MPTIKSVFIFLCIWGFYPGHSQAQITVGTLAPDFSLPDTSGNSVTLDDFSGSIVLLNFFTTWCEPCKIEVPQLQDSIWTFYDHKKVAVVGMDYMESNTLLKEYIHFHNLTYYFLRDTAGTVFDAYGFRGFPSNIIIDQSGTVAYASSGFNIPLFKHIIDSLLLLTSITSELDKSIHFPDALTLLNVYPNPFNPSTIISYQQTRAGTVLLKISDGSGKIILYKRIYNTAGINRIHVDLNGHASGIYYFEIVLGKTQKAGRLILLK